jgi:hypothetical protein
MLVICLLTAHAQSSPISVSYQKRIDLPVPGATAAYSLDSTIVEAAAANGIVEILGKGPGSANIIVVTSAGVQTIAVTVPMPPPVLPPGFEPPERQGSGENGNYEVRYNSDPKQLSNSIDFKRTQGQSFTRMQIVNANLFSAGVSGSTVGFPFLAYEIGRPNSDITFLDKNLGNTPLTVDGFLVRGFHLREGPWEFHGGFTSIATFQGLFLATDREYTAGVSRLFELDKSNSLQANLYYFQNPDNQRLIASNGAVGSLAYRLKLADKGNFLAELGLSHGVGFASRGTYDDNRNHISGDLRIQSRNFASLAVNNQHGTLASFDASRKLSERLYGSLDLNQTDYNLPTLSQNTFTSSSLLNFKINRYFSVNGGGAYSTFQSKIPAGPRIATVNLPAGVDFSTRHFGTGFQYQRTLNIEGGGNGNDFAVNARASAGRFQLSGFYRHDVQVPTLAAIFSQVPGLQDALDRAGIVASTPEQLADLLRNTAILQLLGFTNAFTVDLAPARNDLSADLGWISQHPNRRKIDLSYFNSNTELVQGKFILSTATLSYSQRLHATNDIVASASLVRTTSFGVTTTKPLFSVSLQHRFYTVPGFLLPGRHGMIEGHVFRDNDSRGLYNAQLPAVAGVEVRLDDNRVTHTDASGYYSFHHVPFGVHRVEAMYQSAEPFFYTTDSPATVDMNATVDFGINFAKGQIFGYLLNDAGTGISGITIELKKSCGTAPGASSPPIVRNQSGASGVPGEPVSRDQSSAAQGCVPEASSRRITTGENGKFSFTGLIPGDYSVASIPDSYPPGYALEDLTAHTITVESGKPASTELKVRALRSIAGHVLVYDKTTLQTVPVPGVTVRLKELSLEVKTGATGAYIFRNLAAGAYTIAIENKGREITRSVTLPSTPANLRDIDLNAGARETPK